MPCEELSLIAHISIKFLECKFNITDKSGVITSPGYPDGYPSNADCKWVISASPGYVIQLIVMVTSIGATPECTEDYLKV